MPVHGLGHINYALARPELEAVRDFYVDILGLVVGERPPFRSFGYWLYAGDEPVVHLVESASETSATAKPLDVTDHVAFRCSDYDGMLHRIEAAGIAFQPCEVPASAQRQLFLSDPAGIRVELLFDQ